MIRSVYEVESTLLQHLLFVVPRCDTQQSSKKRMKFRDVIGEGS